MIVTAASSRGPSLTAVSVAVPRCRRTAGTAARSALTVIGRSDRGEVTALTTALLAAEDAAPEVLPS